MTSERSPSPAAAWLWVPRSFGNIAPSAERATVEERDDGWRVVLPEGLLGIGRRRPPPWEHAWLTLTRDVISRFHCQITTRDGACWILDQHSTGGTYVNQERVSSRTPQRLRHGDELFLLGVRFFVAVEGGA